MSAPQPFPTYTVIPADLKTGSTMQEPFFKSGDFTATCIEALKRTAATGKQYIIFTSTHFTEKFEDLPPVSVEALVFPYTP